MSVNEVKIKQGPVTLQIRGTGSASNRTFAIGHEDHTLGNALRHVLIQNAKVEFAGYSVPHPSDPVVHIRVQAHEPTTAISVLQEACNTLSTQCQIVLKKLEEQIPEVKQDRINLEAKWEAMNQDDGNDEDEMVEDMDYEDMED
jgi:DNA-directed RNA polymerases I and III subunit RPAC2